MACTGTPFSLTYYIYISSKQWRQMLLGPFQQINVCRGSCIAETSISLSTWKRASSVPSSINYDEVQSSKRISVDLNTQYLINGLLIELSVVRNNSPQIDIWNMINSAGHRKRRNNFEISGINAKNIGRDIPHILEIQNLERGGEKRSQRNHPQAPQSCFLTSCKSPLKGQARS